MKYKTKPVEIEAVEYIGSNTIEISKFTGISLNDLGVAPFVNKLVIKTLEGKMTASVGDFIIKGLKGEFYPCKPDIFNMKYEPIINNN